MSVGILKCVPYKRQHFRYDALCGNNNGKLLTIHIYYYVYIGRACSTLTD